jgi:hypothetical protein
VDGDLINNADILGLVIESNANLKNNSSGVKATVSQDFVQDQWHYFTTPVSGSLNVNDYFHNFYIIGHTESTDAWNYLVEEDFLNSTTGYGAQYNRETENDTTVAFAGTLITGDQSFSTNFTDHTTYGWNLIGNPYACTIDWTTGISLNGVDNAIYLWDPVAESYDTYVDGSGTGGQDQYIAPMQGFFVRANTTGGSVAFSDASKTISTTATFKSATVHNIIRLCLSDFEGRSDESLINITANATDQFDARYDASKLKALTSLTPQLWSVYEGEEYAINSLPELSEELQIPLQIMIKQTGVHTLSLSDLEAYSGELPVYLYDAEAAIYTDLTISDYTFKAEAGELKTLMLSFKSSLTLVDELPQSMIKLRANCQQLILSGMNDIPGRVMVSSLMGQVIFNQKVESDQLVIPVAQRGVYLVKVIQENGQLFNGKVVVNF